MKKNRVDEFIKNPKRALFVLSSPVLVAMLVQTMYNIVDTAFVGRLGSDALAALTFTFPVFFFLVSINSGLGIGMGSRISRLLGAKKKKEAENTAVHGLLISLFLAVLVIITGILTQDIIFSLFGASGNVLSLAKDYMSIIIFGVSIMFPVYVMNNMFSAQGDTKTPMKVQITGLLLNIILDPIFIYVLGYGVKGAAIATVIALAVPLVMNIYFLKKKSYLKIRIGSFKYSYKIVKEIFSVGVPASFMMIIVSVYVIFLNKAMAHFGTDYVAAFGLASRLESLVTLPVVAFSMSTVTLVGMFYGAKRYDLVKKTVWYSLKICTVIAVVLSSVFFAIPSLFFRVFTSDVTLLMIASTYMRVNVFTLPFMPINMIASRVTQGLGFGLPGFIIHFVRIFVVAIPLAYFFVFVLDYGFLSIAFAMVIGGMTASIVALVWLILKLKKIENDGKEFLNN